MALKIRERCEVRYLQPDYLYRKHENISQSELKEALKSPAHYLARYGPNAEPCFPSAAMIIGTALHAKVLEPEAFDGMFYDRSQAPKELTVSELKAALDDNGTEYPKAAKKSELESLLYPDGKPTDKRTSLNKEDFATVLGMAEALRGHPTMGAWFSPGGPNYRRHNEISLYVDGTGTDENAFPYGLQTKGRIDRLERSSSGWQILDLKTTDDASPSGFQRKCAQLNYAVQAAFYTDLVAHVFACDPANVDFVFCAVERRRPHLTALYSPDGAMLEHGREQLRKAAASLSWALESESYPGYSESIETITLPRWATAQSPAF